MPKEPFSYVDPGRVYLGEPNPPFPSSSLELQFAAPHECKSYGRNREDFGEAEEGRRGSPGQLPLCWTSYRLLTRG